MSRAEFDEMCVTIARLRSEVELLEGTLVMVGAYLMAKHGEDIGDVLQGWRPAVK